MIYLKTSAVVILLFTVILHSCAHYGEHEDAHYIRDGLLQIGIEKQAFLDVWGPPDRTGVTQSDDHVSWGLLGSGHTVYDVWTYEAIGIELLFDSEDLVAWKTNKTTHELKSFAKPKP